VDDIMSHQLHRQHSLASGSDAHASGSSVPIVQTNCDVTASFEELFGVLKQPANEHIKPWSDRNLPNSFYKEPSDCRHGTRSPIGAGIRHQSPKRTANGLSVSVTVLKKSKYYGISSIKWASM
jgi:hypothetical protein